MLPKRVIPCLDVLNGRVVKGTEFTDIQDVGDPVELARHYELEGADELVFLDITATAENRSTMVEIARKTAANVFIPFTVGGGVRSEIDAQALLDAGADKVAVNSAALEEPALINELAGRFGRQCVVLAIDAKRDQQAGWEAYSAGGRVATGRSVEAWAQEVVQRGAGEVLLTSIDRDGTKKGYDLALIETLTSVLNVPVIASGGAGQLEDYRRAIQDSGAEAVLAASQFHSGQTTIREVKDYLISSGVSMRLVLPSPAPREGKKIVGKNSRIAIVDYGTGNRYSIKQALKSVGAAAEVTGSENELAAADGIVLPGVGAFQPAMDRLQQSGLDEALRRLTKLGKPILGICLGEQLLFDGSSEDGQRDGLGLISGQVREIETDLKPNIGWRNTSSVSRRDKLLVGLTGRDYFYHLHQYAAVPAEQGNITAWTELPSSAEDDYRIPSAVSAANVYGVQFHPEKSGEQGLRLLENFVQISKDSQAEI